MVNDNSPTLPPPPQSTTSIEPLPPRTIVTCMINNDVLCGRGSGPNDHVGNVKFRQQLVGERREEYLATNSRSEKARIAKDIVKAVHNLRPPGRFLEKVSGGGNLWRVVEEDKALEKAKQALRQIRHRPTTSKSLSPVPPSNRNHHGAPHLSPVRSAGMTMPPPPQSMPPPSYNNNYYRHPYAAVPPPPYLPPRQQQQQHITYPEPSNGNKNVGPKYVGDAYSGTLPPPMMQQQNMAQYPGQQYQEPMTFHSSPPSKRNEPGKLQTLDNGYIVEENSQTTASSDRQSQFVATSSNEAHLLNDSIITTDSSPYNPRDSEISMIGNISESACDKLIHDLGRESSSLTMSSFRKLTSSSNSATMNSSTNYNEMVQTFGKQLESVKSANGAPMFPPKPSGAGVVRRMTSGSEMSLDFLTSSVQGMSIDGGLIDDALLADGLESSTGTSSGQSSGPPIANLKIPAPRSVKELMLENQDSMNDLRPFLRTLDSNVSQLEDF